MEKKNTIELDINKTLKELHGNPFGVNVYNNQIKNVFNHEGMNNIVFPDFIEDVSASFVQGLCSELKKEYGRTKIFDHVKLCAKDKKLEQQINDYIEITW